jgi:alkylated DNA repair dioxygenase AlkB
MGAQYDWSTRQYPPKHEVPSEFPADIARFVSRLFPPVKAESGVVLVYGTKDYMPVHRDVSELCDRELCSFTLGCDGLFVVSLDRDEEIGGEANRHPPGCEADRSHMPGEDQTRPQKTAVIRVRSGDVVVMAGPTRWCWHAMPKVLAGSCPEFLRDWPLKPGMNPKGAEAKAYKVWKGYMTGKRINISC